MTDVHVSGETVCWCACHYCPLSSIHAADDDDDDGDASSMLSLTDMALRQSHQWVASPWRARKPNHLVGEFHLIGLNVYQKYIKARAGRAEGLQPPLNRASNIFVQSLIFFSQKTASSQKFKKMYLLNENIYRIHSVISSSVFSWISEWGAAM